MRCKNLYVFECCCNRLFCFGIDFLLRLLEFFFRDPETGRSDVERIELLHEFADCLIAISADFRNDCRDCGFDFRRACRTVIEQIKRLFIISILI